MSVSFFNLFQAVFRNGGLTIFPPYGYTVSAIYSNEQDSSMITREWQTSPDTVCLYVNDPAVFTKQHDFWVPLRHIFQCSTKFQTQSTLFKVTSIKWLPAFKCRSSVIPSSQSNFTLTCFTQTSAINGHVTLSLNELLKTSWTVHVFIPKIPTSIATRLVTKSEDSDNSNVKMRSRNSRELSFILVFFQI